jgi:pyruvate formate lyase activating enzyme
MSAALPMVLEHTDAVLFDLKIMDPEAHLDIIRVPNEPILRNIKTVVKKDTLLTVKVPLIPEITDTEQNIASIAQFVKELDSRLPINILPYHRLGMSKYKMLDREYELAGVKPQSEEKLEHIREQFLSQGLSCEIVR